MKKSNRKVLAGLLFIGMGVLFMLDNFDLIGFSIPYSLLTWQMILVSVGIYQLIAGNRRSGIVLMTIGLVFWLPQYLDIHFRDYWPVILIMIGLGFFLRGRSSKSVSDDVKTIDDVTVLAGSQKRINSKDFGGGNLSVILGGIELDLRNAELKDGKVVLDAYSVLGGIKLFIPDDWVVNFEATNILGGFRDKRAHKPTEYFGNVLTINGIIIMGSIELNS